MNRPCFGILKRVPLHCGLEYACISQLLYQLVYTFHAIGFGHWFDSCATASFPILFVLICLSFLNTALRAQEVRSAGSVAEHRFRAETGSKIDGPVHLGSVSGN